jgi:hypothetical protein
MCLGTATTHCLEVGGKHSEKQHFSSMMACAEMVPDGGALYAAQLAPSQASLS